MMREKLAATMLATGLIAGAAGCVHDEPSKPETSSYYPSSSVEPTTTTEFLPNPDSDLSPEIQKAYHDAREVMERAHEAVLEGDFFTAGNEFAVMGVYAWTAPEDQRSIFTEYTDDIEAFHADNKGYREGLLARDLAFDGKFDKADKKIQAIGTEATRVFFQEQIDFTEGNAALDLAYEEKFDKAQAMIDGRVDNADTRVFYSERLDHVEGNAALDLAYADDLNGAQDMIDGRVDDPQIKSYYIEKLDYIEVSEAYVAATLGDMREADILLARVDDVQVREYYQAMIDDIRIVEVSPER